MSNRPKNVVSSPNVQLSASDVYHRNIIKLATRKALDNWAYNFKHIGTKSYKQLLSLLRTK